MRKLLWIGGVLLLLIGGGAWWLFSSLDRIVASAIRSYAPEITQVDVTLDSAKVLPAEGQAALYGLTLGNPKGFATSRALSVGQIRMSLDVATITQDVVRIKELTIERPEITYELASGASNLDVLQRNVEAYVASKTGTGPQTPGGRPEKKVVIDHLYIQGGIAQVSAPLLKGKVVTVPVPDLHLKDIGKKGGGATAGEAARQVFTALTQSMRKNVSSLKLGSLVEGVKGGAAAVGESVKGWFR